MATADNVIISVQNLCKYFKKDAIRALVHARAPEAELLAAARAQGMRSMREDGDRLIEAGTTSLEEVLRVTRS